MAGLEGYAHGILGKIGDQKFVSNRYSPYRSFHSSCTIQKHSTDTWAPWFLIGQIRTKGSPAVYSAGFYDMFLRHRNDCTSLPESRKINLVSTCPSPCVKYLYLDPTRLYRHDTLDPKRGSRRIGKGSNRQGLKLIRRGRHSVDSGKSTIKHNLRNSWYLPKKVQGLERVERKMAIIKPVATQYINQNTHQGEVIIRLDSGLTKELRVLVHQSLASLSRHTSYQRFVLISLSSILGPSTLHS